MSAAARRSSRRRHAADPPEVNLSSISGMQAAAMLFDRTAAATASFAAAPSDLTEQVGNLMMASVAYSANAQMVRTQDEVQQSLIDVIA